MTPEEAKTVKIGDEAWVAVGCIVAKVRISKLTKKTKHRIISEIWGTVIQIINADVEMGDEITVLDDIFRMGTDDRLLIKEIFK